MDSLVETSVNTTATGSFNENQLRFLRRANLKQRDYMPGEVPVMRQRSAMVAFFSEMLEMFGLRKYDHQYDIDDSSISLEVSEDEHQADASSFHEESTTCDLEKNYPPLKDVGTSTMNRLFHIHKIPKQSHRDGLFRPFP